MRSKANLLAHRFFKRTAFSILLARTNHRLVHRKGVENRFTSLSKRGSWTYVFLNPSSCRHPAKTRPAGSIHNRWGQTQRDEFFSGLSTWSSPLHLSAFLAPGQAHSLIDISHWAIHIRTSNCPNTARWKTCQARKSDGGTIFSEIHINRMPRLELLSNCRLSPGNVDRIVKKGQAEWSDQRHPPSLSALVLGATKSGECHELHRAQTIE